MCFNPGGGGTDNSQVIYQQNQDREARAAENARVARIELGRQQIDRLFDRGETLAPGTGLVTPASKDTVTIQPGLAGLVQQLQIQQNPQADTLAATTTDPQWQATQPAFDKAFYDKRTQAYIDNYTPQLKEQFQKASDDMAFALARAGLTRSSVAADQGAILRGKNEQAVGEIGTKAATDTNNLREKVEENRTTLINQLASTADPGGAANQALARTQVLAGQPIAFDTMGNIFAGLSEGIGSFVSGVRQKQLYDRYPIIEAKSPTGASKGSSGVVNRGTS